VEGIQEVVEAIVSHQVIEQRLDRNPRAGDAVRHGARGARRPGPPLTVAIGRPFRASWRVNALPVLPGLKPFAMIGRPSDFDGRPIR